MLEATASRPRNRKDELAAVALASFYEVGYERVGMADIAAAVGITGGAVYRHFASKAQLLARVFDDQLTLVESALDSTPGIADRTAHLHSLIERLTTIAPRVRPFGTLLQRESRHLAERDQFDMLGRVDGITTRLATAISAVRPDLSPVDATVLGRAVLALLGSASFHVVPVTDRRAQQLTHEMIDSVVATRSLPRPPASATQPATAPPNRDHLAPFRTSRREALLASAISLFGAHGYVTVRLEDIGVAAGVTGPAIYQYFDSKADVLAAALTRSTEWLGFGVASAFASSATPGEALTQIIASCVDFLLDYPELMTLLVSEVANLPDANREARALHEYAEQWASLLVAVRPGLDPRDALFTCLCTLTTINDAARSARVRDRHDAGQFLTELARDVLQYEGAEP